MDRISCARHKLQTVEHVVLHGFNVASRFPIVSVEHQVGSFYPRWSRKQTKAMETPSSLHPSIHGSETQDSLQPHPSAINKLAMDYRACATIRLVSIGAWPPPRLPLPITKPTDIGTLPPYPQYPRFHDHIREARHVSSTKKGWGRSRELTRMSRYAAWRRDRSRTPPRVPGEVSLPGATLDHNSGCRCDA